MNPLNGLTLFYQEESPPHSGQPLVLGKKDKVLLIQGRTGAGKTPGDGRPARLRHGEPRGDGSAVVTVVTDGERKEDGPKEKEPRNAG